MDRNTLPWTNEYLTNRFTGWEQAGDDHTVKIENIKTCTGDSNVSQRKGKVICYFDLYLEFSVILERDGEEVARGTIEVPEFMHDEQDFEVKLNSFGANQEMVKKIALKQLVDDLLAYQVELIATHSEAVQQN